LASGRSIGFRRFGNFERDRFSRFHNFPRPFIFGGGCIHGAFFGGFPCRNFLFGGSLVWGYAPYYADYSDYPDYGSPAPPAEPAATDSSSDSQLAYEVGRLSTEVDQLRDKEGQPDDRHSRISESGLSESGSQPDTPVTLVFRTGKTLSVQNYAIVGNTVWVLGNRAARKIPLSDLDIAATQKANSDNGVEFHLAEAPADR